MDHEKQSKELITAPIPGLIKKIAIPASVGFFFNTMYNVVDTFFGGLVSTEAIAALALSFPVFFLIIAFGSGIGTGSTALITNALGEGDTEKAKKYTAQSISFSIIISVFLTALGLAIAPFLFKILGAEGEYLGVALSYINVIFYGTAFFVLNFTFNAVLNSVGDTKSFRNFLIIGFFINPVLNFWFMFGGFGLPAMGLAGVALGTIVVEMIGVIYLFPRVLRTKLLTKESFGMMRPQKQPYIDISKQGFPASLNMMTVALGIFIITFYISKFGSAAVAAYGVATRVEQIFLLPTIGLNIAALTLIGQNNGAKRFDRVKEIFKRSMKYSFYIMTVATIGLFIFANQLMDVFTNDIEVIKIGAVYLRIAAFMTWAYPILFIINSTLQGLKKPMFPLFIGLFRQIIAPVIVFGLMIYIFDTGLLGVWWGIFGIVWGSVLIAHLYFRKIFSRLGL